MPMTTRRDPGSWRDFVAAVGGALKRWVLGKSGHDYMKRFAPGDAYWDVAFASQRGWPQQQPPKPEQHHRT